MNMRYNFDIYEFITSIKNMISFLQLRAGSFVELHDLSEKILFCYLSFPLFAGFYYSTLH